ncbi:MAG: SOS response-associated peptidase family protein [Pseudomonadales bacterium]
MCGSFSTQRLSWREINKLSRLTTNEPLPEFVDGDRFPMRRKQKAVTDWNRTPIVRERDGKYEAIEAAWGLVPMWWSKPLSEKSFDTFNAKVEREGEAKSFKHTLKSQRFIWTSQHELLSLIKSSVTHTRSCTHRRNRSSGTDCLNRKQPFNKAEKHRSESL